MTDCPRCRETYSDDIRFCPRDGTALARPAGGEEILGERYRLIERIGSGGMASIYRAEHVFLGRPLAVKLIARELSQHPEAARRFQREAQLAARLRHPNIVEVVDFGRTVEGQLYFVMELVAGTDLRTHIREHGALPFDEARAIVRQIAEGLEAAHALGIIHRDLKSANVMLTRDGSGAPHVKLVDFGISKAEGGALTELTIEGAVLGTPEYMAPEQVAGQPVDRRCDVYSLGIVLYEMLSGVVPFSGTLSAVLQAQVSKPPPPIERAGLPSAVEVVVRRALEKDPGERFESALSLVVAFEAAMGFSPGAASPRDSSLDLEGAPSRASVVPVPPLGRKDAALRRWLPWLAAGAAALLIALDVIAGRDLGRFAAMKAESSAEATRAAPSAGPTSPSAALTTTWPLAAALAQPPTGAASTSSAPAASTPTSLVAPVAPAAVQAISSAALLVRERRFVEARQLLEAIADTRVACERAPLYIAAGDPERAITDAERCLDLQPERRGDPVLARALVQGLGGSARKRAYQILVKEIGEAARSALVEAATDPNRLVRAGAYKAVRKLKLTEDFDRVAMLLLDLGDARKCKARKKLVLALVRSKDVRALPRLEKEVSRPKREIACFDASVFRAMRKLRKRAAPSAPPSLPAPAVPAATRAP